MGKTNVRYQLIQGKYPTKSTVNAILRLYTAEGWAKETENARLKLQAMVCDSFAYLIAITEDGSVIGTGKVISDGHVDAYIQDICVDQAYRQSGIGGEIVKHLTQFCQKSNIGWIALIAFPGTPKFYHKHQFKMMEEGYVPMLHHDS